MRLRGRCAIHTTRELSYVSSFHSFSLSFCFNYLLTYCFCVVCWFFFFALSSVKAGAHQSWSQSKICPLKNQTKTVQFETKAEIIKKGEKWWAVSDLMVSELESATRKKKKVCKTFVFLLGVFLLLKHGEAQPVPLANLILQISKKDANTCYWLGWHAHKLSWKWELSAERKHCRISAHTLRLTHWCFPGGWWTGVCPPQAALIQKDGQSRKQQQPWRFKFFFLGSWGVITMQQCVQANALFNSLWLSPYSPVSCPVSTFSLSFCISPNLLLIRCTPVFVTFQLGFMCGVTHSGGTLLASI